jgi:chorismate synthase
VERTDAVPAVAAGVVGEAVVALVLARACLEKLGGDTLEEAARNLASYRASQPFPLPGSAGKKK